MNFQAGDRVRCFGTDKAIQYFSARGDDYSVVGTVVRRNCYGKEFLYKVEVDHSGSQDSEGHNAVLLVHEKQMEPLDHQSPSLREKELLDAARKVAAYLEEMKMAGYGIGAPDSLVEALRKFEGPAT